jgi:hypothetical protein
MHKLKRFPCDKKSAAELKEKRRSSHKKTKQKTGKRKHAGTRGCVEKLAQ